MSAPAPQGPEVVINLITNQIRSNIEAVLATVRADRSDPRITTPKPVSYYISEKFDPLQMPAVFVLLEDDDFQKDKKESNYENGKMTVYTNMVISDLDTEVLTRRCYRYMAAMRKVLDQVDLTSQNNEIKITIVVESGKFSPTYTKAQKPGAATGVFMKEFSLRCSVYYSENF